MNLPLLFLIAMFSLGASSSLAQVTKEKKATHSNLIWLSYTYHSGFNHSSDIFSKHPSTTAHGVSLKRGWNVGLQLLPVELSKKVHIVPVGIFYGWYKTIGQGKMQTIAFKPSVSIYLAKITKNRALVASGSVGGRYVFMKSGPIDNRLFFEYEAGIGLMNVNNTARLDYMPTITSFGGFHFFAFKLRTSLAFRLKK